VPNVRERGYTFALVFKSRDPQALDRLCGGMQLLVPDCRLVFRHGPSPHHLWVIEAKAPTRGEHLGKREA
jgi:hypothetical protein